MGCKLKKISVLVGKPIVSIFEGKMIGYVKNVIFDDKINKIDWIEFFDEENENEFVISAKDVYAIDDIITIKNNDCVIPKNIVALEEKNPINFSVVSVDGKNVGKIIDIELDDKLKIDCFVINNNSKILPNQMLNIGKNIAVLQPEKTTKISHYKPNTKIFTKNVKTNNLVTIENKSFNQNKITVPKKILTDNFSFLIGRKLDKNIYTDNKQLIAKKHSIITSQIIDVASKNGKLKELTYSSPL